MATDSQIRANRRNAQKSTGPKSIEGKEKSKYNATKHGLTAKHIVLPWEEPESYHELHGALLRQYQPQLPAEMYLVDQLAQNWWRMNRSRRLETQMFENMNPDSPGPAPEPNEVDLHRRYESAISRDFYRAYDRLEKIIRRRERESRDRYPARQSQLQPAPESPQPSEKAAQTPTGFVSHPGPDPKVHRYELKHPTLRLVPEERRPSQPPVTNLITTDSDKLTVTG